MQSVISEKLKNLPSNPGIYFFKDRENKIIYIGKAAVIKNRVRQYFQRSRSRDAKTNALVAEIVDVDWMEVESEIEALFLESEMIRRYLPPYNILLRDDKSLTYIRIDIDSNYPTVSTTRRPLDDGAKYFGPYLSSHSIKQALRLLRRIFPYATQQSKGQKRANLHYHLGLDPGLEEDRTSLNDYKNNLRRLIAVIEGKRKIIEKDIEKSMKLASKNHRYEEAAVYRNQLNNLRKLDQQIIFSDREFQDISKDHALDELCRVLGISFPFRIEGYDISHMQGTDVVASMVVFTNGVSNKGEYRKFKTKTNKNDDFYNMNETIKRRFSHKNKSWVLPNLVLIDGGKGQLDAALKARDDSGIEIPFIGLAKRDEDIVVNRERSNVNVNREEISKLGGFITESNNFVVINIPKSTNLVKLLQRVRDESHRFAVSYHSAIKTKRVKS
ncbi:GIY-YIG nuclease family protein, partial [Candidatus Saccharibacteria bacterium]|nr:GIY-YIG nuclease family protein [Candidatus Saccharibacteria bacterium]